jgi:DNA-binding transcriptional ArsR family regulator
MQSFNRLFDLMTRRRYEGVGGVFKALSNETRLTIMGLIFRHGPLCVCEVEQILGITQPKASRHLRYLRDAGVLEDERDGLLVNYGLPRAPDGDLAGDPRGAAGSPVQPARSRKAARMLVQIREGAGGGAVGGGLGCGAAGGGVNRGGRRLR